ncbi:hypothetical protein [Actinacidiphila soli]|jgi:hypothetical protein|uniref:hypothetical protein n=1 Tax=Actinacidiphila soli TaxID=2487275 RepID=UPI001F0BCCF3|nr:hypothetical protein [Actinacidiphila soli]
MNSRSTCGLQEIHANLIDRLQEAKDQGWLGEVDAIEDSLAAEQSAMSPRGIPPSISACLISGAVDVLIPRCDGGGAASHQ